jgi:uncharacterized protein YutE (UPF0331/DUF86 family)
MIREDMVRERLTLIQDAVMVLGRFAQMPVEEFLSDIRNPAAAESYLRRALEAVFDVGRHLLASRGNTSLAAEYKGIARGLGEAGLVDGHLAGRLAMMAGYRNRLVHLYAQVSPGELHHIVQEELGDLTAFVYAIDAWLESEASAPETQALPPG